MRSIVTRNPLVSFFVLAFALSWWAVPLGGFLPFGPLLAACIVIGCVDGRPGLRALGRRMLPRRGIGRWYVVAVAVPLGVVAVAIGVTLAAGAPPAALRELGPWYLVLAFGALRLIDPLDGPLGEEPGWRGYALPQLLAGRSPLRASMILGALVALWHAPLVFLPAEHMPALFLLATVAVTFVYTWLYLRTDGNVFTTILAHSAEGTIKLGALGFVGVASTRLTVAYTVAWVVVATGLVLVDRKTWAIRTAPNALPLRRAAAAAGTV